MKVWTLLLGGLLFNAVGAAGDGGASGGGGAYLTQAQADTLYSPLGIGGSPCDTLKIGSIYQSILATNPATLLGCGTWVQIAQGRVLVGQDGGDTQFDVAEETSGSKTTSHSHGVGSLAANAHSGTAVADHASHTHAYTQTVNHTHTLATGTTATGNFSQVVGTVDTSSGGTGGTPTQTALGTLSGNPGGGVASGTTAGPSATLTHGVTQPADHTLSGSTASDSTSVVQPSFVVYIWKRTL